MKQCTLSQGLDKIDSPTIMNFEMHCTAESHGVKSTVRYSDYVADDPSISIEKFIEVVDNYGSFWLTLRFFDGLEEQYQIIEPNTN